MTNGGHGIATSTKGCRGKDLHYTNSQCVGPMIHYSLINHSSPRSTLGAAAQEMAGLQRQHCWHKEKICTAPYEGS